VCALVGAWDTWHVAGWALSWVADRALEVAARVLPLGTQRLRQRGRSRRGWGGASEVSGARAVRSTLG
jgi:hypothetical protein